MALSGESDMRAHLLQSRAGDDPGEWEITIDLRMSYEDADEVRKLLVDTLDQAHVDSVWEFALPRRLTRPPGS